MKKLNNNGFAIASVLYSLMVLFLMLLLSILGILGSRKAILDKNKKDILDGLNSSIKYRTLKEKILINGYSTDVPDFSTIETNNVGLIQTEDSDGYSYYYRGSVDNNYVLFANYLWRIIRINGDGSVRLILDDSIGIAKYNELYEEPKYVGYTYDKDTNETDSTIKSYLEDWYNEKLINYDQYIVNTRFCNDTSLYSGDGLSSSNTTIYGAGNRLQNENSPSLICPSTNLNYGGEYWLKIGLITADEVVLAGGYYHTSNTSYYLYDLSLGAYWWNTMTPHTYSKPYNCAGVVRSYSENSFQNGCVHNSNHVVRPVINIKGDILVSGSGIKDNPYFIIN